MSMSKHTSSNIIGESSKSQLDDFYNTTQESVEKGVDTSFKTLNTSIYSIVNSTFSTFGTDYEKRLDKNREAHEKAIESLTSDLKKSKKSLSKSKKDKKVQQDIILSKFHKIQSLKKKGMIMTALKLFAYTMKENKNRRDTILAYLTHKKILKIFTAWRNFVNSLIKGKLKLKYANTYNIQHEELTKSFADELNRLKNVLQSLELDIDKESEERRALSKLYDISMKQGVEAFLKETNYIVNLNSSNIPTPHERSFEITQELNKAR